MATGPEGRPLPARSNVDTPSTDANSLAAAVRSAISDAANGAVTAGAAQERRRVIKDIYDQSDLQEWPLEPDWRCNGCGLSLFSNRNDDRYCAIRVPAALCFSAMFHPHPSAL